MVDSGIYIILSPSNRVYIGSSCRLKKRKARHFSDLRNNRHDNVALQRAWTKYQGDLKFVVIEHCDVEVLIQREQHWMDFASTLWDGNYNQRTIAGKPGPLDEGTRRKLSIAMTGFRHSEETKAKMRKPKSPEHAIAISKARTGVRVKPHSDETKRMRSEILKRQYQSGERNSAAAAQSLREKWSDPEYKAVLIAKQRATWTDERRTNHSARMRNQHRENKTRRQFDSLNWIVGSHPLGEHTN